MPWTVEDVDKHKKGLSDKQKRQWVHVANSALERCVAKGGKEEECAVSAIRQADSVVGKGDLVEFSLVVRKTYQDASGEMRWKADASDIEPDHYGDSMSLELYQDFLGRIENEEKPPERYCSEFWAGGVPYLSVSHYLDQNGAAVPGPVDSVYIDGKFLKAKGRLSNTPLGVACFNALSADFQEKAKTDDRVRISIAFLDYMHKHKSNDYVFTRDEKNPFCPECMRELLEGEYAGKTYLKGHLIHLALTRVPVNPRTLMEVEKSMTTRKEDAASIVGEELAEQLDEKEKLVGKSDALVIKTDTEKCPKCGKDMADGKCPECDKEDKAKEEKSLTDSSIEKCDAISPTAYYPYGGATSLQEAQGVLDAQKEAWRLSDLWRMVQDVMENIFANDEISDKSSAIDKVLNEFKNQVKEKSDVFKQEAISARKDVNPKEGKKKYGDVTFADEKNKKYPIDTEEHIRAAWNYINKPKNSAKYSSDEVSQIKGKIVSAWKRVIDKEGPPSAKEKSEYDDGDLILDVLEELRAEIKAIVVPSAPLVVDVIAHPLDAAITQFKQDFDSVILSEVPTDEKLRMIQEPFNVLGNHLVEVMRAQVKESAPVEQSNIDVSRLADMITNLSQKVELLSTQVSAKSIAPTSIPERRGINPALVANASLTEKAKSITPNLHKIINRSVGLN